MPEMFDFSIFYASLAFCTAIGVLSVVFARPIKEIIAAVDRQSDGRTAHH
ncbi:MAG: hypothetical protein ACUVTU_02765 [Desulfurispora sp.]